MSPSDSLHQEITPVELYRQRHQWLSASSASADDFGPEIPRLASAFSTEEATTTYREATGFVNFYEFGSDKYTPVHRSQKMRTEPWSITVDGLVEQPREFSVEDLLQLAPLEERVYRMRCVEAWSMVIPWLGLPLATLLAAVKPTAEARYVEFISHYDPAIMVPDSLNWPYREGLRLDEAMHPLTLLAVGMYGEWLLPQNGAPLRLVVPWKYAFKNAKSLVGIRLIAARPLTSWEEANPAEYGFYANVNPEVDHPRWSQASEQRIGEWRRRPTLPFNGYADQVAHLYDGMDLRREF